MHVKTIRKPGEPGTHKLLKRFGERLVCVRYRYDPVRHKRYKTAEIIVAEEDWLPPPESDAQAEPPQTQQLHRVGIRIAYHERELRRRSARPAAPGRSGSGCGGSRRRSSNGWGCKGGSYADHGAVRVVSSTKVLYIVRTYYVV